MKITLFRYLLAGAAGGLVLGAVAEARAEWFDQGPVLSITEENDTLLRTDRYYTQGFKLAYLHTDNRVPGWIGKLSAGIPAWGYTVQAVKIGAEVGQDIYTPANIKTNVLLVNDRPYAGWLYTGFILQRKGLSGAGRPVLENFQLDIGIIGPDSLADRTQSWAHGDEEHTLDDWSNQLKNELGLALKYERIWLFSPGAREHRRFLDFLPRAGLSLGNVDTSLRAGGLVRLGINLPDDFGPQLIHGLTSVEGGRSASQHEGRYGFYIFTGVEGRVVLYNAALDGNLGQDSHHVTKEPVVGEFNGGVAVVFPYGEMQISGVYQTHEFELQNEQGAYCSLVLKFKL